MFCRWCWLLVFSSLGCQLGRNRCLLCSSLPLGWGAADGAQMSWFGWEGGGGLATTAPYVLMIDFQGKYLLFLEAPYHHCNQPPQTRHTRH